MTGGAAEVPRIDRDACVGCGACIAVCPDEILVADPAGRATVAGSRCLQCGHCHGVCPVDAVSVPFLAADMDLAGATGAGVSSGMAASGAALGLYDLMRRRRSCRCFTGDPVPAVLLEDLVKAGCTAPSGTNSQGWRFLLLPRRADVVRLGGATADFYRRLNRMAASPLLRLGNRIFGGGALQSYHRKYADTVARAIRQWDEQGRDRLFHGATAAIVVAAARTSSCPAEDALLATQNILLAAEASGLGSCLVGFVVEAARRDRSINRLLGLEAGYSLYSVIGLGYPAVTFHRPAGRKRIDVRVIRLAREETT